MYKFLYPFVWLLKKSKALSAFSCRLTQITGKSKYRIHPKHLISINQDKWLLTNIDNNDVVLDLGCGNGQTSLKIAKRCKKIMGIDHDNLQLQIGRKSARDEKIENIKFINRNLEKQLPFKNKSFDKVICSDILEHIGNRKKFLLEIKRVLKLKGIVFIAIPNKDTSWKKLQRKVGLNFYSDPDHKIEYSLKEIKKVLSVSGFKILSIKPIVYDTPWSGFIDLIGGFSLNLYKKLILWKRNKVRMNLKESIGFRIKTRKH